MRCEFLVYQKVVHRPAVRVQHHAIKYASVFEAFDIVGEYMVDKALRILAADEHLSHVGDIEHPDILADRVVLVNDALVLDRHVITGKRAHLSIEGNVLPVQTSLFQLFVHI